MIRIAWLVCLASSAMFAQTADSQTLQALLHETRQLRLELSGITTAAQRAQILIYRVQLQHDIVKMAGTRQDLLNSKIRDAERNRAEVINELKEAEEKLAPVQNPNEREVRTAGIQELKRRLEISANEESGYRAAEVSAGIDLRTEQAKLLELHQRLDRLEQQLEKYASPLTAK